MAVITISRGSFSGGKMLAECLAKALDYRCVDRDVIVEKAAVYGVPQDQLKDALDKPPSFWDRFKHTKYVYLTLIQAALAEEVQYGKAVYHGNAGHLLLRGISHVLRVRIIAPMPFRLKMIEERLNLGPSEALGYIEKMDHDRRKWTQYLYGVEWDSPTLYDIVLNLEVLDIPSGCENHRGRGAAAGLPGDAGVAGGDERPRARQPRAGQSRRVPGDLGARGRGHGARRRPGRQGQAGVAKPVRRRRDDRPQGAGRVQRQAGSLQRDERLRWGSAPHPRLR